MNNRIRPGGPFLRPSQVETPAPLTAEDGDDSWWSGLSASFASIPQASATTALAITVAIAGSFNGFNEDVPPQPIVAQDSQQQLGERAIHTPVLKHWEFTDELPAQPLPVDELQQWPTPQLAAWSSPPAVQYFWTNGDEIAPTTGALPVDDAYWLAPAPELVPPVVRYFWHNDEITQAPTSSAYEEICWGAQRALHALSLKLWEVADELPQATATPDVVPDQQDAFIVVAIGVDPLPTIFSADDEIVPAAAALGITEPEWQVYTPPWLATRPLYLPDPDQAAPTPPAALAITEPEWQVYTPPWPAPQPLYLPDPDQAFAPQLRIDETEWQVYTPPWPAPQPLYLPDPEQAVPKSLLIDEMYWAVYTPPLMPKIVRVWFSEDEFGDFIENPIYGWGARGGVGRTTARDPWSRIGSEQAVDQNASIGTDTAVDPNTTIGTGKG